MIIFILLLASRDLCAQEKLKFNTRIEMVTRYVWRGLLSGHSVCIQPEAIMSYSNASLSAWGSYPIQEADRKTEEIDLTLSYQVSSSWLFVTPLIRHYYYPGITVEGGNSAGLHILEAGINFSFQEFPLSFELYRNIYNDAGSNMYFEVNSKINMQNGFLLLFAGATSGSNKNPGYYGSDSFEFINTGFIFMFEPESNATLFRSTGAGLIYNPHTSALFVTGRIVI